MQDDEALEPILQHMQASRHRLRDACMHLCVQAAPSIAGS
jgi:hypothetical protein